MKLYTSVAGLMVTDDLDVIQEEVQFHSVEDYNNCEKQIQLITKKYKNISKQTAPCPSSPSALSRFRTINMQLAIKGVRDAVGTDLLIDHAINNIDELDKTANLLAKRLREWYELYLPEISKSIQNHEAFVRLILEKNKQDMMKDLNLTETMGADLREEDVNQILTLAYHLTDNYALREKHLAYLESKLKEHAPNLLELLGTTIAAKLIEHAGNLKRLAILPSSTVQLLGAEKALFRHLTRGARPPKYGIIINHPFITNADKKNKGKAARALADKISMCARLDYFKGEFKAPEYRKSLEAKFK